VIRCGDGSVALSRPACLALQAGPEAKEKITPSGAFDKPLTKPQVLAAAGPLIKK
jgi:hypothetical protein